MERAAILIAVVSLALACSGNGELPVDPGRGELPPPQNPERASGCRAGWRNRHR